MQLCAESALPINLRHPEEPLLFFLSLLEKGEQREAVLADA